MDRLLAAVSTRRERPGSPSERLVPAGDWKAPPSSGGVGDCVKFGRMGDWILVGDTKCPDRLPLVYTVNDVQGLIQAAKDGKFDQIACLD